MKRTEAGAVLVLVAAMTTTMTACPLDPCGDLACGEHGSCDSATGACVCDQGFSGAICETFDCATLDCGDHGVCEVATGSCACDDNWRGARCDNVVPLEVIGAYTDDWQFDHDITQDTWVTMDSTFHITRFSNEQDHAIANNDAANAYDPGLWSRFDWTTSAGELYVCQITYNAASEDAALAVTTANRSDLATGCNSYAWSKLTPR